MDIESIHPQEFVDKVHELMDADMRRFARGREKFVSAPCPACQAMVAKMAFALSGFEYQCCDRCQTVYLSPRPTAEQLALFFAESEGYRYWVKNMPATLAESRRKKLLEPRLKTVTGIAREFAVARGCVLEVGAGDGTFARMVKDAGDFEEIWLLEPAPVITEQAGCHIIPATIEDAELPAGRGDLVLAFEVLEHLLQPVQLMVKASHFLKDVGLLYLTTPNVRGFEIEKLGVHSTSVGWDHFNYFHPDSLRFLLESNGFDVLRIETPGKLDLQMVRRAFESGKVDFADDPLLRFVLTEGWESVAGTLQNYLARNGCSSHMVCLARKRSL